MRRLKRFAWLSLAISFLAVSWLWDTLRRPIEWVIARVPLDGLKRGVARFMDRLPAYPTLIVFLVPVIALEPMKIVALWLFAHRQLLVGVCVYVGTDLLRVGVVSFLFNTSRDKLLSIRWFAWLYDLFERAHHWAREQIAPLRQAVHRALVEAGLISARGRTWRKVVAVWRFARRGGFRGA
jgi:hypothetical protein